MRLRLWLNIMQSLHISMTSEFSDELVCGEMQVTPIDYGHTS